MQSLILNMLSNKGATLLYLKLWSFASSFSRAVRTILLLFFYGGGLNIALQAKGGEQGCIS